MNGRGEAGTPGPSGPAGQGRAHVPRPVPEELLGPLVEVAADVLRGLDAADVPSALRPVHGFDRRGLVTGPGRRQVLRAYASDEQFRTAVNEQFCERDEVRSTIASWSVADAEALIDRAAATRDLPFLASVLYVDRPDGADFGLGLIVARAAEDRRARADEQAAKDEDRARATREETQRRNDAARIEAETAVARLTDELQKERGERRAREATAAAALHQAQREIEHLEGQLRVAADGIEQEQLRTAREAKRAHALEHDVRRLRGELDAARDRAAMAKAALDVRELAAAATDAEQVAARLRELERKMRAPVPLRTALERPAAPTARARPDLAPGLAADTAQGVVAMLGTPDLVLAVDGYNITQRAWPEASAADQRERLGIAVTALHRRLGCTVLIVFDGDGSGVFRPPLRRGGVRVLFSDAAEEADEVIVRQVAGLPKRIPVVVASSDAWVREHAEAEGAVVVGADALVQAFRPER